MGITTQAKSHLEQAYTYYEEAKDFAKALEKCQTALHSKNAAK
jgi:hypothetical protein